MTGDEEVSGDPAMGCDGEQRGKPRRHLEVFDYVTTPRGKGVVICSQPYLLGVILDTSQEVVHFERPEDIDLIQPTTFVSVPSSSEELLNAPCQEDEYQYLDPYGWPYNDPDMTDEYLSACGFPTREAAGYPVPTKPAHVERLLGATIVSTPKGRGKLWRNWDTQVGVIREGTRYVTIFHTPEEWAQILPVHQDPQRGIDEMRLEVDGLVTKDIACN